MKHVALSAVLVVATLATPARATDRDWSTQQLVLGGVAVGLHLADWGQTRHIARSNEPGYTGQRYVEAMPLTRDVIGEVPTTRRVDTYMLGTGLLFIAAAHFLPEYRTAILATWAVSRVFVVVDNHELGLRIGGSF
jgi:hypothetical protein